MVPARAGRSANRPTTGRQNAKKSSAAIPTVDTVTARPMSRLMIRWLSSAARKAPAAVKVADRPAGPCSRFRLGRDRVDALHDPGGEFGRRARLRRAGDDQEVAVVGRYQVPAGDAGVAGRHQGRQPLQHQPAQAQRVPRDQRLLSDAFQAKQPGVDLGRPAPDVARLQQGQPRPPAAASAEKRTGRVRGDVVDQLRHERLGVLHADALEKPALPQPGLDHPAAGDQGVEIGRVDGDVDDHLVLHGVMQEQVAAVGHDRVGFREGAEDVGVDLEPRQAPAEEPERDRQGQGQETPVQGQ